MVDANAYLRRYLRNLATDQFDDGRVPPFIPAERSAFVTDRDRLTGMACTSVGWGDVTVMLPWTLYQYTGDEYILRRQYDSGKAWVEHLERRARKMGLPRRFGHRVGPLERYIVDTGFSWGEWLRPGESAASEMPGNLLTGRPEVATAYLARSAPSPVVHRRPSRPPRGRRPVRSARRKRTKRLQRGVRTARRPAHRRRQTKTTTSAP